MNFWKRFKSLILRQHDPCPRCHVYLKLTGKPPENHSEWLVKKLMGVHKLVPLHWLEEQVSDTLYHEELRLGAGTLDIGVWGPTLFAREAARILADIRPEFASLVRENGTKLEATNKAESQT